MIFFVKEKVSINQASQVMVTILMTKSAELTMVSIISHECNVTKYNEALSNCKFLHRPR